MSVTWIGYFSYNVVIGGFSREGLTDWVMKLSDKNCFITANRPLTMSNYNFADELEQNTAVYALMTTEEI